MVVVLARAFAPGTRRDRRSQRPGSGRRGGDLRRFPLGVRGHRGPVDVRGEHPRPAREQREARPRLLVHRPPRATSWWRSSPAAPRRCAPSPSTSWRTSPRRWAPSPSSPSSPAPEADADSIEDYRGLAGRRPWLAARAHGHAPLPGRSSAHGGVRRQVRHPQGGRGRGAVDPRRHPRRERDDLDLLLPEDRLGDVPRLRRAYRRAGRARRRGAWADQPAVLQPARGARPWLRPPPWQRSPSSSLPWASFPRRCSRSSDRSRRSGSERPGPFGPAAAPGILKVRATMVVCAHTRGVLCTFDGRRIMDSFHTGSEFISGMRTLHGG